MLFYFFFLGKPDRVGFIGRKAMGPAKPIEDISGQPVKELKLEDEQLPRPASKE